MTLASTVDAACPDDESEPGYRVGEAGFRRLTTALLLAGVATFATLYSPQPLLPLLAASWHVSAGSAALTLSVSTLGLAAGMPFVGPLSDALGRTAFMRGSVLVSGLLGLGAAVAPSWTVLLILRAAQGFALAGLPAVAMAYLREEVHGGSHTRATGQYIAGTAIGGMVGRLLAGALVDVGWRVALGAVALLCLGCVAVMARLLPPSANFRPVPPSRRALTAITVRLLRDPVQLGLYAVGATLMGTMVAVYNALGFRLAAPPYELGAAAGLVFLVYPIGSLGSALAGRVAERYGRRRTAPFAALVIGVGLAATLARPLPALVAGTALITFGFFATHSLASGWVAARAHATGGGAGQASAMYLVAYYLGASVFGGLAGTEWSTGGWPLVTLAAGALTAGTVLLTVALRGTAPAHPIRREWTG
ncbi:MAG TPA: MFS transporter [Micromonosporaceae bacterium]